MELFVYADSHAYLNFIRNNDAEKNQFHDFHRSAITMRRINTIINFDPKLH